MFASHNVAPRTATGHWRRIAPLGLALALIWWGAASAQQTAGDDSEARNYDARVAVNRGFRAAPGAAQQGALNALRGALPDLAVTYDEQFGVTRTLTNHAGQLTLGAPGRDPLDVALSYVQANPALLGISAEDLADYEMTDLVANPATGSTHVYFRQMLQGLPVYNGQLHVNVDRESRIMSVNNQFVPALAASLNAVVPSVSAATAVARAAEHLGIALAETPAIVDEAAGIDRVTRIDPAGVSREPITARLMLLPVRLKRFSNRPCTTWGGRGTSARTDAGGPMRAYSMDLRERALLDSDAGMKAADVATKYRVSGSWVRLLKQRRRDTGEVAPRVQRQGRRGMREPHLHTVAALLAAHPDRTLAELKDALATPASVPTVWRAVRALGLTVKKNGPPVRTRSA